jgi:hypothetical protein
MEEYNIQEVDVTEYLENCCSIKLSQFLFPNELQLCR